jgi:hypothetical protein
MIRWKFFFPLAKEDQRFLVLQRKVAPCAVPILGTFPGAGVFQQHAAGDVCPDMGTGVYAKVVSGSRSSRRPRRRFARETLRRGRRREQIA